MMVRLLRLILPKCLEMLFLSMNMVTEPLRSAWYLGTEDPKKIGLRSSIAEI